MDIELYAEGKDSGDSGIELHGVATLLVKLPAGFDPKTGAKLPPIEQGFQRDDLQKMRDEAAANVERAQATLANFDALLADADLAIAAKAAIAPKVVK